MQVAPCFIEPRQTRCKSREVCFQLKPASINYPECRSIRNLSSFCIIKFDRYSRGKAHVGGQVSLLVQRKLQANTAS